MVLGLGVMEWAMVAQGFVNAIATHKKGVVEAEADRYRASLAEENARRAEFVAIDAEIKARNSLLLDAGLFRMQATQSGLSGVSKDLWVGQRYMDVYRDVTNARITKEQTLSRFLKEAGWHRKNALAHESSAAWSIFGTVLSTMTKVDENLQKREKNKGNS